jgi:hypothetical protein
VVGLEVLSRTKQKEISEGVQSHNDAEVVELIEEVKDSCKVAVSILDGNKVVITS